MGIAFNGIKKGLSIFWDDSILLISFNFICFLVLLPAMLFFSVVAGNGTILTSIINALLVLPFVFFIFPLYYVLFDCRKGKAIGFRTYFDYLRKTWKQALIYGGINLLLILLIAWNLRFYAQFEAAWAGIFQIFFLSVSLVWAILQIIMLPLYPRLDDPAFRLALQNAAAISGRYVVPVLALVFWTVLFIALTLYVQILGIIFTFAFIAVFGEGIVGEAVLDMLGPPDETNPPSNP